MVEIFKFSCPNNRKACEKHYDFENDALFVWSKETCVGDEVFCQFFSCRGKREIYFYTFCHEMTEAYRDSNIASSAFLSAKTFISCMMSWIINQGIDYRSLDAICPFCGHNPEVLACDGVAVGVSLKFLTKHKSIATAEKQEIREPLHRRNTRVLISGLRKREQLNRQFLRQYCDSIIKLGRKETSTKDKETDTPGLFNSEVTQNEILESFSDFSAKSVMKSFFEQKYPLELSKALANLLKALNGTASLFNFFPLKDRQWLLSTFEALKDMTLSDSDVHAQMKKLHGFRVQFSKIMQIADRHQRRKELASFFQFLINRTSEMHAEDFLLKPEDPSIVDTYDPTKGISYNFTPHGAQIRRLPKYDMDGKNDFPPVSFIGIHLPIVF